MSSPLKKELLEILRHNKFVRVKFRTKRNTTRTMVCTRNLESVGNSDGMDSDVLNGANHIAVYDHLVHEWRAIRVDAVEEYSVHEQMGNKMLTKKQQEILDILTEEAAEVIQCVSKIRRFGLESCHPSNPNYSNLDHLTEELGDLVCMIELTVNGGICDGDGIDRAADRKLEKLKKFNLQLSNQAIYNQRRLTNLGTFRAYVEFYLKQHHGISEHQTIMVRQLQPTSEGLPLEIYCFANTTVWKDYEAIQADIFDHLIAILPEFGLRIYQAPSGSDMKILAQHTAQATHDYHVERSTSHS